MRGRDARAAARARRRRADPRLAQLGVDGDRAVPRGGRRVLVDRAERDRARAGALRARGASSGRTRTRSRSTGKPEEYRCAPLVQLRLVPDWARTIARHLLYETADAIRIEQLKEHEDAELAGIAAKIEREEVYHRLHAEMWLERLRPTRGATPDGGRGAVAVRARRARRRSCGRRCAERASAGCEVAEPVERGAPGAEFAELWEEMTMVRRSAPVGCAVVTEAGSLGGAGRDPRPGDPGDLARRPRRRQGGRGRRRARADRVHADLHGLPRARRDADGRWRRR